MAFSCTLRAPHGGIWVIGLVGKPVLYLLAIAVGTAITAVCVVALKSMRTVAGHKIVDLEPAHV